MRAAMGVLACAPSGAVVATIGHAAGLREQSRAVRDQGRSTGILPLTMQRAKLQSCAHSNRTGEGMQPLR